MVSFSNDFLHVCQNWCIRCLENVETHMIYDESVEEAINCQQCGRNFNSEFCFESHKVEKLKGKQKTYFDFLSLKNCKNCMNDFALTLKCNHFGKKEKRGRVDK